MFILMYIYIQMFCMLFIPFDHTFSHDHDVY